MQYAVFSLLCVHCYAATKDGNSIHNHLKYVPESSAGSEPSTSNQYPSSSAFVVTYAPAQSLQKPAAGPQVLKYYQNMMLAATG